jgi:pimeloyl-ACP methyl ester carboxylesterase
MSTALTTNSSDGYVKEGIMLPVRANANTSREIPSPIWYLIPIICLALLISFPTNALADGCNRPQELGDSPTRLIVIVPAVTQGADEWTSFLDRLKEEKESQNLAVLVYEHNIGITSLGDSRNVSKELATCIDEKVKANGYQQVTIIGHSMGGMLARYAYLHAAGAFPSEPPSPESWAAKVDKILLFASVNKGISPDIRWWGKPANWLLRTLPHPHFIAEDFILGSDFIADVRIAWIRHFGQFQDDDKSRSGSMPKVVQFWGTKDTIVSETDNADLEAFSGPVVIRVSGATHGNLYRLEPNFVNDVESRWALFRKAIFDELHNGEIPRYKPRRILIIARGIRDSSNSGWVQYLSQQAEKYYGKDNIEKIEYGYFSAVDFAFRPLQAKNIPRFRDLYAQRLAENPLTEFDFIGHSNGTYIFGHSLLTTLSIRFRNVVLAAPVLPTDFDWQRLIERKQVQEIRYDTAQWDWPVGILCQALRAIGYHDVGPSGVVLFGEGTMVGSRVKHVGWYNGGHGSALRVDPLKNINNLQHLLEFAITGEDTEAGDALASELGPMQHISRAVPFVVWTFLLMLALVFIWWIYRGGRLSFKTIFLTIVIVSIVYAVLDII